jgi:hypothetical protein
MTNPNDLTRKADAALLAIARRKITGGPDAPFFKAPYLDAAFNGDIFLWDTCMIAAWAKYFPELPITQALDNFYSVQRPDGFICRQYAPDGSASFDSGHPISVNPPLLTWAEWELHGHGVDPSRLQRVYPALTRFHRFLEKTYRCEDGLFFSDSHGSGMDNLTRSPRGWTPDDQGIRLREAHCHKSLGGFFSNFLYREELAHAAFWNRQGRSVDFSAQMAFDAHHLSLVANALALPKEADAWQREADTINAAINTHCWDPATGFYSDLGYGKKIPREHIGMFWTLWSGAASDKTTTTALVHALKDPKRFGRPVPVPSLSASDPDYSPWGNYWRGGVWPPTCYMVLRGLAHAGLREEAVPIAQKLVTAVDHVFELTGTFWENYAPEFPCYGNPALPDFCGWTPLIPVAIRREFLAA